MKRVSGLLTPELTKRISIAMILGDGHSLTATGKGKLFCILHICIMFYT